VDTTTESYFEQRGKKNSEESIRIELIYQEKRQILADMSLLHPKSAEYKAKAKLVCNCAGPGMINAGCCAHGLSTLVVPKSIANKKHRAESWNSRELV